MSNKNSIKGKGANKPKTAPKAIPATTSDSKSTAKVSKKDSQKSGTPSKELCQAFNRDVLAQNSPVTVIKDAAIRAFGKVEVIKGANAKEIAFQIGKIRMPKEGYYMGV